MASPHQVRTLLMYPEVNLVEKNIYGQDALWLASAKGHIDIVKVLIEKLRRSGKLKQRIEPALKAAEDNRHHAVARVLRKSCGSAAAQPPTPMESAEQSLILSGNAFADGGSV
jgi:ankyrin repeat protein